MSLMDLFRKKGIKESDVTFDQRLGPWDGSSGGGWGDWFHDMKGRRPFGRTIRPDPDAERGDWIDWFLNRRGLAGKFGGSERYKYDSYNPYDYQLFQKGGLVNPHEETTRAAREWNTREQPPRPWAEPWRYDPDRELTPPKGEPYRPNPAWEGKPYPVTEASSDWNNPYRHSSPSGVMLALSNSPAINKMKNIYNQVDPFFPDIDLDDQQIGYDFNKNLWGGTLGFGGEYDINDDAYNAYINWGTQWPKKR